MAKNEILTDKDDFIKTLQENIVKAIRYSDVNSTLGIDEKLDILQRTLLDKMHDKKAYDKIADEIFHLRELKEKAETDTVTRNEQINRINDLQEFIAKQGTDIEVFDEKLVRRLIAKITVFDDWFIVEFKSGVEVRIEG